MGHASPQARRQRTRPKISVKYERRGREGKINRIDRILKKLNHIKNVLLHLIYQEMLLHLIHPYFGSITERKEILSFYFLLSA